MIKNRRTYDREFKLDAVRLASEEGRSVKQVAHDLGVNAWTLRDWIRSARDEGADAFRGSGNRTEEEKDLHALRRELELVKQERDILKKALAVFSRDQR